MDDKLKNLLLKARKGSCSAISLKDAIAILQACGCSTCTETDDVTNRQIVKVDVHLPTGEHVTFHKDPTHRRLSPDTFFWGAVYNPNERAKQNPIPAFIKVKASELLGMPTYEQEKADKKKYGAKVDIKNTGTCACCFKLFKMEDSGGKNRVMVLHGYLRPGDGHVAGQCSGRRLPPIEIAPDGVEKELKHLKICLAQARGEHKRIAEGGSFTILVRNPEGKKVPQEIKQGDALYGQEQHKALKALDESIKLFTRLVKAYSDLLAAWVPDELPEVRYPKKQPLKLQPLIDKCY